MSHAIPGVRTGNVVLEMYFVGRDCLKSSFTFPKPCLIHFRLSIVVVVLPGISQLVCGCNDKETIGH